MTKRKIANQQETFIQIIASLKALIIWRQVTRLSELKGGLPNINIVQTSHFPNFFLIETLVHIYLRT